jgi:hypothetical protein
MSVLKTIGIQHLNGSSPNIQLASNGNVGIANNNPNVRLVVDGPSTGTTPIVKINATSIDSGTFQWLSFSQAALANGQNFVHIFGKALSSYNCGYIGYKHAGDNLATNSVTLGMYASDNLLNIYGNGAVTMPSQPMTCRRLTGSPSATTLINWDTSIYESGISYNSSTRRFTVPIAGRYQITFSGFKNQSSTTCRVLLGVNTDTPAAPFGSNFGHTYTNGSNYNSMNFTVILNLAANDYFVYYLTEGNLYTASGDAFNFMTAQLVG